MVRVITRMSTRCRESTRGKTTFRPGFSSERRWPKRKEIPRSYSGITRNIRIRIKRTITATGMRIVARVTGSMGFLHIYSGWFIRGMCTRRLRLVQTRREGVFGKFVSGTWCSRRSFRWGGSGGDAQWASAPAGERRDGGTISIATSSPASRRPQLRPGSAPARPRSWSCAVA